MKIPYTITDLTITLYVDGQPFTVDRSTQTYQKLLPELQRPSHDVARIKALLDNYGIEIRAMRQENVGLVTVTRREVLYNGERINDVLARRILDISAAGLPIDPWVKFVKNLYSNPAEYARDELYLWLEKADLPITEDGCFLAYKKVSQDFKDLHTGTFDNSPGTVVTMPGGRPAVDPIRDHVCSTGLHFCSKEYLPSFGWGQDNRVVLVKINPADVVSIPSDYDNTKGRTWKYEVLQEVEDPATKKWEPIVAEDATPWMSLDPLGRPIGVPDLDDYATYFEEMYDGDAAPEYDDEEWEDEWEYYYSQQGDL